MIPHASSILCSFHGKTLHAKLDGGGMEKFRKIQFSIVTKYWVTIVAIQEVSII